MEDILEILFSRMDDVMEKYVGGNLPPCAVTDPDEVTAILAGMGEADFEPLKDGIRIIAKRPCQIFWNGKKFEIYIGVNY